MLKTLHNIDSVNCLQVPSSTFFVFSESPRCRAALVHVQRPIKKVTSCRLLAAIVVRMGVPWLRGRVFDQIFESLGLHV